MVSTAQAANLAAANRSHNAGPGWFEGAPVTKLLIGQVLLFYMLQQYLHIRLVDYQEPTASILTILGRLMVQKCSFATTGPLVVGTPLLALFSRQCERELGSLRFSWLIMFCNVSVVLLELLTINFWNHMRYEGPYPIIGACLWLYYRYTPRLYPNFVSVLGLVASEKVFYYCWFAQILYPEGIKPALMGACACALFLKLELQFPVAMSKQVSALLVHIQSPPRVLISVGDQTGLAPQGTQVAAMAAAAAAAPRPAPRPVVQADPAAVEQLIMMGFDQDQVVRALQATDNNVQRAADQLLSQMS